jgi:hypothetical protein
VGFWLVERIIWSVVDFLLKVDLNSRRIGLVADRIGGTVGVG